MKVLHVCESIIGGTGSYLSEVVADQGKIYGPENVCLLIPASQKSFLEQNIVESGTQIRWFQRPSRRLGVYYLMRAYLDCVRTFQPNIVHAHSSIAGLVTRLSRPRGRYRLIFCPHGWAFDIAKSRAMQSAAAIIEFILSFRAHRIVLISRHDYVRGTDVHIQKRRLKVVLNGISRVMPDIEPAEWNDDRLKVLFVGRLDRQKGADILLEAIEPISSAVSVRMIGDLAVDKAGKDMKKGSRAEFLGWLSRIDVAAQMMACDVLVVPSRWEGFGLVVIEAMRLSKPVVGTSVGGLREILQGTEFGFLVPPEDPEALRACLLSLPRDQLAEKGKLGRQRFFERYTSDRMVQEIDAIYRTALAPTA